MLARWSTFVVWALVAASALMWSLKLFVAGPPLRPRTTVAATAPMARGDLSRLLGVEAPPPVVAVTEPAPDARYQLVGVVTPRAKNAAREGLALIAVDGKPAKAFRVGAVVDGNTVLKAVAARGATLGPRDGAALVALNIAAPASAATGALPPAGAGAATVAAPAGAPAPVMAAPVARPMSDAPPPMRPLKRLRETATMQPQDDAQSK